MQAAKAGAASGAPEAPARGGGWIGLGTIVAVALLLRLLHLREVAEGPFGAADYLPIDARLYHAWATDWLAGSWPKAGPFFRPPLYTWFVGAVYAVFGPEPGAVKLVQSALGAVTSALVWAIARELSLAPAVALLAAALWAFCGIAIYFDAQLLPGSLDAFLQTALVWRLLVAGRTRRAWAFGLAGVLVGLCALHRGGVLLLLPLLLYWIYRLPRWTAPADTTRGSRTRFARAALALLIPAALVIAPVSWRNAAYDVPQDGRAGPLETLARVATGRFVTIAETSAVNLRLGNAPVLRELNDVTHPDHFAVWNRLVWEPYQQGIRSVSEANRWVFRRTLREIAEQPEAWLGLVVEKALAFVNGAEIPRNTSIYPDRAHSRVLRALLWKHAVAFPSGLVIPFALAGIWLLRRSFRQHFVPFGCLAAQGAFVVAFFVTARYRLPSLALLSIYAAHAAVALVRLVRARRRADWLRLSLGLALLMGLSNHRIRPMPKDHWPVEHYDLAMAHLAHHQPREAETQLRAALALDPEARHANAELCKLLVEVGRPPEALPSCQRAVAADPGSAELHERLGTSLEAAGRRGEAIAHYRQALRLEPGRATAAEAIARALARNAERER